MFITTSLNPDLSTLGSLSFLWPGSCVLANLPGHSEIPAFAPIDATVDPLIFEFLTMPAGQLEILRQMMLRIRHFPNGLQQHQTLTPLLYCPEGGVHDVTDLLERAEADPWVIEAQFLDDDKLEFLLLGSQIIANPLFTQLLLNLAPNITDLHSREVIDAMRQHLVPKDTIA